MTVLARLIPLIPRSRVPGSQQCGQHGRVSPGWLPTVTWKTPRTAPIAEYLCPIKDDFSGKCRRRLTAMLLTVTQVSGPCISPRSSTVYWLGGASSRVLLRIFLNSPCGRSGKLECLLDRYLDTCLSFSGVLRVATSSCILGILSRAAKSGRERIAANCICWRSGSKH